MRIIFKYIVGLIWIISACTSENEFQNFDTNTSYIYFDMPKELGQYGKETNERIDSIEYSFAMELAEVTTYDLKIPMAISGIAAQTDRYYTVELVGDESTVSAEDWDISSIDKPVFKKGVMFDTLKVKLNRTSVLKEEKKIMVLQLKANDQFELGREDLLKIKIIISDILIAPVWWEDWKDVFGPFYLETYLKWQEIYYEGADPNYPPSYIDVSNDSNKPYYWDNMPIGWAANYEPYTPSVFIFIAQLRTYFEENEVYGTNPDGSKTRIKIY
ncbi:MAG: DUF4843 domain-containing protein [Carboxylicivirga sp.]|jgi:hypothetical protein|nr:DUF4843 domain-containing protein [Carboxylicivirga sp.]MCT4645131.1 DUF4843 domain-containing protein [Carboxylicivirga sp.]